MPQPAAAAPRIVFGTYTGNGTYGEGHSTALHLDFAPRAVIVLGYATNGGDHMVMLRPCTSARSYDGNNADCAIEWLDDGVQWTNYFYESTQFNRMGQTYYYLAIQ